MNSDDDRQFDSLLDYLKQTRGFDFAAYKRASLIRRVTVRLQLLGLASFGDYIDYLEVHPEEFNKLFNTILINVTSFFRDEAAWEALSTQVIPRIVENKAPGGTIRAWCAGAASGEEAYSLAMVLAEKIGAAQFQQRVKIYATDVDEEALNQARQAVYTEKQVETIPKELREKYFERNDERYVFRKDLRRSVIFGRHDLIQDAPISRVDILVCRNTLIYFNSETQAKVLLRFHFALNDDCILFLGKSEMLLTHSDLFVPLDLKRRIFSRARTAQIRDELLTLTGEMNGDRDNLLTDQVAIREAAFDTGPAAQMVADTNGILVLANARARTLFGITSRDIGRPFSDLGVSYRPVELRSQIEQAYAGGKLITLKDVEWKVGSGEPRYLDIQVMPLIPDGGAPLGVTITCTDVSVNKELRLELQRSHHELETAYEELQSANEELETTNEELQSTNEELETMNEELQSTNEELETVNTEMQRTSDEANRLNSYLDSVLTSVQVGVLVVDPGLSIQIWNRKAEDLWGLRADEVKGQHFPGLDIGLPMEQLTQPVRACLAGDDGYSELMIPAINRRGQSIECRVTFSPLRDADGVRGAIVLMEERNAQEPS